MKKAKSFIALFLFLLLSNSILKAQQPGLDSTGLPGDNFNLQGALQIFKDASNIEEFEKALNQESNNVNNLDLNADGDIDYIKVTDKQEKNAHVFILRAIISQTENQDIAVIELEKNGDESAIIQIVGDEDIFGEQVIVEPGAEGDAAAIIDNFYNTNESGPNPSGYQLIKPRIVVNVWLWPTVRFVFGSVYRPWVSPWRWAYYPTWWKVRHPLAWHVWHPFRTPFRNGFRVTTTHRVVHAHRVYTPLRTTSVVVRTRNSVAVNNFRVKRSRTVVHGPAGRTTTIKKTTVKGPRGNKSTRVKVRR